MPTVETRRLRVHGQVQGVGFRPFVYRLAGELGLTGEVSNQSSGVIVIVQGGRKCLDEFESALRQQAPGKLDALEIAPLESRPLTGFQIAPSRPDGGLADVLLADRALCAECRRDYYQPGNPRHAYPFIACASCGPRYSVCRALPWDRENTSWARFPLCARCKEEFTSSGNRRFHAIGISCPECGPTLMTTSGELGADAVARTASIIADGGIVAVKNTSGFHLMADADNGRAVSRLMARKQRSKPLAIMAPDLEWLRTVADTSAAEIDALTGSEAPIVLLHSNHAIADTVAAGTGLLGAMLPHSGIQLALMDLLQRPLVATSGNLSEAPLVYDNPTALRTLAAVADGFLFHDLELVQGLDDSVIRVMDGQAVTLRLGRGLAPQIHRMESGASSVGCGAHLKTNIALQHERRLIAGPYVGDLNSTRTRQRYRRQKQELPRLLQVPAGQEITDLHPDYGSTVEADYRAKSVPHHVAHAMSLWLEHQIKPPFLALSWDGVGLGPDGGIWGGECLLFQEGFTWCRVGSLLPFRISPRYDMARFPGKVAAVLKGEAIPGETISCSSMGRLIEGLAALAGLRQVNDHEAQVAMEWEALAWQAQGVIEMDFAVSGNTLDWRPLLPIIGNHGTAIGDRALGFHRALARAAINQCLHVGITPVLLTGGVFQNRMLVESILALARDVGLEVLTHHRVPPNDGGISLGQCVAHALDVRETKEKSEVKEQCA